MATKVRKRTLKNKVTRFKHKRKINSRISGTEERPRLCVFKSNRYLYAHIIDDQKGHTLASASTLETELKGKATCSIEGAKLVGDLIAKRALAKNAVTVVFDRSGYVYKGKVKSLADAAREGGLKF